MNILYFNKDTDFEELRDIVMMLNEHGIKTIALPDNTHLMVDMPVEHLFDVMDRVCLALEYIRKERPQVPGKQLGQNLQGYLLLGMRVFNLD